MVSPKKHTGDPKMPKFSVSYKRLDVDMRDAHSSKNISPDSKEIDRR
jgi:hypothetical protein